MTKRARIGIFILAAFLSCGRNASGSDQALVGSWRDAATGKSYVFTDTVMRMLNIDGAVSYEGSYAVGASRITVKTTILGGLPFAGDDTRFYLYVISGNECDLTPADENGSTGARITLTRIL